MARVAVAYVEVRPDLAQFGERLRAALTKVNVTEKVKVEADTKGFAGNVAKAAKQASGALESEIEQSTQRWSKAQAKAGQQYGKKVFDAEAKAYADMWKERMASFGDGQKLITEGIKLEAQAAKTRAKAQEAADNEAAKRQQNFFKISQNLVGLRAQQEREIEAEQNRAANKALAQSKLFYSINQGLTKLRVDDEKRVTDAQDKQAAHFQDVTRNLYRFKIAMEGEAKKESDKKNREAAENYVRYYQEALTRRLMLGGDIDVTSLQKSITKLKTDFERSFGDKLGHVFAPLGRQLDKELLKAERKLIMRPKLDTRGVVRDASKFVRRLAGIFGERSILGRAFSSFGSLVASTMEAAGSITAKVAESIGSAFSDAGKGMSQTASKAASGSIQMAISSATAAVDIASMATSVAGLVAILAALIVVAAAAAVGISLLEAVLGTILAVVIPLVGGITALVGELAALAGVGLGSIALLPGALIAATAAFGPLMLVADKFQKLMENTAQHTGALFVAVEKLKNGIFAVMTLGFIEGIQRLATTVLPKLFNGIILVAEAWNRLFLTVIKLAATPAVIDGINAALQVGADIVDVLARAIADVGPSLMQMAVIALPAIERILGVISSLISEFGRWVDAMNASGNFAVMFDQLSTILGQMLTLLRPIASLMGAWITAILGPAHEFMTILTGLVQRWSDLASSAAGQRQIAGFFSAMNRIVVAFEPLLEKVVSTFLDFGPMIADLTESAVPALNAVIDAIMGFLDAAGPWLSMFMQTFAQQLADPTVQNSIKQLGAAIGILMNTFTSFGTVGLQFIINGLIGLIGIIIAVITIIHGLWNAVVTVVSVFVDAARAVGRFIDKLTELGNKLRSIPIVGGVVNGILNTMGLRADTAGNKAKTAGDKVVGLGSSVKTAMGGASDSLNSLANSSAWGAIQANATTTADYLVDMANNGIRGNNALLESMANLAHQAYTKGNEADQARYEKMVGRASTKPTSTISKISTASKKAGTAAGNAFANAYNSAVGTKAGDSAAKKTAAKSAKTAAGTLSNLVAEIKPLDVGTMIRARIVKASAYDTGKEIANYVARGITSGTANVTKVTNYLYKKMKGTFDQMAKDMGTFIADINRNVGGLNAAELKALRGAKTAAEMQTILSNVKTRQNQLLDQIKTFKTQVVDALAPRRTLVNLFGFFPTPEEVKGQLDEQLRAVTEFSAGLDALAAKGLSPELRRAWLEAGVDTAGNLVQGLRDASPEQIAAINNAYAGLTTKAFGVAEEQSKVWFGVGEETVKGYIAGIDSMQKQLNDAMIAKLKTALAEAKRVLKIKSPSLVYADLGVNTIAGYIRGVDSMASGATDAVGKIFDQIAGVPTAPLTAPGLIIPKPSYASTSALDTVSNPTPIGVRVYIGDRELTDLVKVVVDDADSTRARALYAGRR